MDLRPAPAPIVIARAGGMLGVSTVALGGVIALGDGLLHAGFRTVVAGTLVLCLSHAVAGYMLWRQDRAAAAAKAPVAPVT